MTLASTIEVNTGTLSPTGIVIAVMPGSDSSVPIELWRAPDSAGAPDVANAVMVLAEVIRPGGMNYVDSLPTDGVIYWYRSRTNGNAYGPGAWTEWVNLGAADRLMANAVVALGASDASKNSAAWAQQNARMGPQTQNILPNSGWEDGMAFWIPNAPSDGSGKTVITNAANAQSGNQYLKVTSTTGVRSNVVAADDTGKKRWFEVNPGDLVQWGGWVYRESGTDNCQVLMQTADKDQASVNNYVAINNTAAWVFVQGQLVVPAGIKYVTLFCDVQGNGTATVARFDDVYLRIGLGALSDVPDPNTLYQIRFSSGIADPDTKDGMQTYIDFPATTNFMRVGQQPLVIDGQSNASPIVITTHVNHGYQTGDVVTIRGCTPNTAANGTWTITIDSADPTKFSLTAPTSTGNGATSATGHVVKLSLTIDPLGNLTVYAIIRAVAMTVLGIATFLGAVIMKATVRVASLQQPIGSVYNDTAINRLLMEGSGDLKVLGDAGTGTNNEAARLGTYTVPLGTLTARTTLNQGTGAHYGWNDPDGVADGINSLTLGVTDNQTKAAASRLYNTVGDPNASPTSPHNLPAYDNNYVVKFTLSATATGLAGIHFETVDAQCSLEFSIDNGSSYTAVGGTSSVSASISGAGSSTVTQTFTVTVNCAGAPGTGFRIRLILKGISGGNGAGGGVSVYVYNATNWSTDPWPITWQNTGGSTKTRRGAVLRATSDGTDQQPHAYLEPTTDLTPLANAAEGEIIYANLTGVTDRRGFFVRRANGWQPLGPIYVNAGSNTTSINFVTFDQMTIKANALNMNGGATLRIQAVWRTVTNAAPLNWQLGATVINADTLPAGTTSVITLILTRGASATAWRATWTRNSSNGTSATGAGVAGTDSLATDLTLLIQGKITTSGQVLEDGITVEVLTQ